MMPDVLKEL
jgi:hypothetical protein